MADITELETRITAAFDRIRRGVDARMVVESAGGADVEALTAQLEQEQTANAQLEERVKALKERQDGMVARLEAQLSETRAQLDAVDGELQGLRQTNAELRDVNAQLRAAAEEMVVEPNLINRAIMAELDALRATRDADAAEVDAIIGQLKPLLGEAS